MNQNYWWIFPYVTTLHWKFTLNLLARLICLVASTAASFSIACASSKIAAASSQWGFKFLQWPHPTKSRKSTLLDNLQNGTITMPTQQWLTWGIEEDHYFRIFSYKVIKVVYSQVMHTTFVFIPSFFRFFLLGWLWAGIRDIIKILLAHISMTPVSAIELYRFKTATVTKHIKLVYDCVT